jgi:hypothetical protein
LTKYRKASTSSSFCFTKFPKEELTISSSGKIERVIKYCVDEYLIVDAIESVNYSSDIQEKYDIELGELVELYAKDMKMFRSKLEELEKKYQQIAWF